MVARVMSAAGQTQKSWRGAGKYAFLSRTDMACRACQVQKCKKRTIVTRSSTGLVECHSIPVCRFPIFRILHQLFEGSAAFEQRTFERGFKRLFSAGIVQRHPVLTHRLH